MAKPNVQVSVRVTQKTIQVKGTVVAYVVGFLFTCVIALLGTVVARLPGLVVIGPMVSAIILSVIYRQLFGMPSAIRPGIQFSSKRVLRIAIVLYGFKLNLALVLHNGWSLLGRDIATVAVAIGVTMLVAKWIKADPKLSLLLGIGTGICGAAAIAAVSPILKSKEEDTAVGVGIIALIGTVFTIGYTLLRPDLHMSVLQYGTWVGSSLHEVAHVAAAAAPAGSNALAIAILAKLGRVLLLVPICFIFVFWQRRKSSRGNGGMGENGVLGLESPKVEIPWFLVGFMVTSGIGTYAPIPHAWLGYIATASTFLLTCAMVGLGLNVNLKTLKTKALKPLLAMTLASVVVSLVSLCTL